MSLAPDWSVPAEVSPFKPLPLLTRCTNDACRAPLTAIETWSVVVHSKALRGLCGACAAALNRPHQATTRHPHPTP